MFTKNFLKVVLRQHSINIKFTEISLQPCFVKCYYASKLEAAKHNLQKTWKVINTIILRKKAETGIPYVIQNNQTVNDPKEMADIFNNFFANIGQDLAKKIPKVDANLII